MTTNRFASPLSIRQALHAAILVAATASGVATAADSDLLTKNEVEGIAVGKKLQYVRASDGATVVFDVRSGGRVYYSPPRTQRNISIGGNYTIDDDGKLCFKWEQDKFVSLQDGCYRFRRAGDKILVVGGRNTDSVIGDLVP